jgi:intracellular sulfur oxidation DsrE/DsrF family protein
MLSSVRALFAVIAVVGLTSCAGMHQMGPDKVVYHLNQGNEQASDALRNINNHISAVPDAKIVVVTHAKGVDFLMEGAEDKNKNPYSIPVEALAKKGVEFRVCEITLKSRNLKKEQFISSVKYVPSGVAEVAKLQSREGFSYVKP